jgi:hypothetical protein
VISPADMAAIPDEPAPPKERQRLRAAQPEHHEHVV